MNVLRWNRKSNKKIRPKTLLLFIFSLIMTTFAWFAYSKVLEPTLNIHMASWDMEYYIGNDKKTNPIEIEIPVLYPAMDEKTVIVDIYNNGETVVDIDYQVKSLTIAGITYEAVAEGETATSSNYIVIAPSVLTTDETTNEAIYKGAVTNDITKFPFTIEVEYSAQVDAVAEVEDEYGNTDEVPGEGYLKVTVNWIGDNDTLDSEWGYKVGEYLANNADATAMTIVLSIDSYQVDPEAGAVETVMPSTASTRPYLPEGCTRVPGTSLDTGLVIEDASGNQYVWIEVPKSTAVYTTAGIEITEFTEDSDGTTGTYTLIENDLRNYVSGYSSREDVFSTYNSTGLNELNYLALKQKMLKSIYSHGGFYIGRYETGLESGYRTSASDSLGNAVIKANAYPYNYVTTSQAHSKATEFASSLDGYTSSLMFGIQWDLVMKYLETKGTAQADLTTDSSSWGNYENNSYSLTNASVKYMTNTEWLTTLPYEKDWDEQVLITSGGNSEMCNQNIYDIAGNLAEWTYSIIFDSGVSAYVGGNGGTYLQDGSDAPASTYGSYSTVTGVNQVGFRVALISEADATEPWGDDGSGSGGTTGDWVSASTIYDADGTDEYALHIGDFVNYDAGTWTAAEIAAIQTGLASSPVTANGSTDLPSTAFQFGGFTAGTSRNGNATPYDDSTWNYIQDETGSAVTGWRVFDIDGNNVTLISAGNPEDYYHANGTDYGYISEYILTGNVNSSWTSATTSAYQKRDWNDYVNTAQKAESATVLTKSGLDSWYSKYIVADADVWDDTAFQIIYADSHIRYQSIVDNYSYYWISSAYNSSYLSCFIPYYRYVYGGDNHAFGVRVLVSLSSDVLFSVNRVDTTTLSGGNMTTYGGAQTYNVWDIK